MTVWVIMVSGKGGVNSFRYPIGLGSKYGVFENKEKAQKLLEMLTECDYYEHYDKNNCNIIYLDTIVGDETVLESMGFYIIK